MHKWWFGVLGFLLGLALTFVVGVKANVEGQLNALSSSMRNSMGFYQAIEAGNSTQVLESIRDNFNLDYCAAKYLKQIPGISDDHEALFSKADLFRTQTLGHSSNRPSTQAELNCQFD